MKIPDTRLEVDDFRPDDATHYFLTHYHADHRRGLRRGDDRPIYCSTATGRLLSGLHRVPEGGIRQIDPGQTLRLDSEVTVTAYDANHCPGAIMLRFDVAGRRILHTGDFRYCEDHDRHPELFEKIDSLLVDGTYWREEEDQPYRLPTQGEAIDRVIELITDHPRARIDLGVYLIGKNRIVQAIHRRLGLRTCLPRKYHRVYQLLGMEECVTTDEARTRVRGHPMAYLRRRARTTPNRRDDDRILILPTGWPEPSLVHPRCHVVPYSEHNDSVELRAFVTKCRPRRVINTNDFF